MQHSLLCFIAPVPRGLPFLCLQVHMSGRFKECWSWFAFWCYMQVKEILALLHFLLLGGRPRDIWIGGAADTIDGAPMSPGVGPVGWWCQSRFCWCWHCWQVPPPLPWVGKTPTNCCCGWWTYLCPSVDQMWVSAILLHFWNFVWRKNHAHAYGTLEIINIISNNRNQNIVVQRWGRRGGGDAGYWDMHCLERGVKELSGMMECSISSLGWWLYGCIIYQDFQKYL